MSDKYSATWVSHSSISDFLKCPRAYYIKNIYRNPQTGHKTTLMSPSLSLGQSVHEVLEGLSQLPTQKRFAKPLIEAFETSWLKVTGEKGGFFDKDTEKKFKDRGIAMINRVKANPGPFANLAVKIKGDLPHFWLSEEENIILCGKIDWMEYLPETDSVHIIDFKTSKQDEDPESLQLPIYYLLATNCQHRKVAKASYWYLERSDELTPKELPDLKEAYDTLLKIAKKVKLTRQLKHFKCPNGDAGCQACRYMENIISGKAKLVGTNDFGQDLFVLPPAKKESLMEESEIL